MRLSGLGKVVSLSQNVHQPIPTGHVAAAVAIGIIIGVHDLVLINSARVLKISDDCTLHAKDGDACSSIRRGQTKSFDLLTSGEATNEAQILFPTTAWQMSTKAQHAL